MRIVAVCISRLSVGDQFQDLGLDGGVERGRRLVGDAAAPDGRRWRARSSRAGACRPKAGGGRRRTAAPAPGCRPRRAARWSGRGPARPRMPRWTPSSSVTCWPDGHQRVQRSGRVLRDEADLAAADLAPSAAGTARSRSSPSKTISPLPIRPVPGSIRRMDIAVAVLPDPLSPTSASVSPPRSENDTSRTARTSPRRVMNEALRSRTSRTGPRGSGLVVRAGSRLMVVTVVPFLWGIDGGEG